MRKKSNAETMAITMLVRRCDIIDAGRPIYGREAGIILGEMTYGAHLIRRERRHNEDVTESTRTTGIVKFILWFMAPNGGAIRDFLLRFVRNASIVKL
jgi:hypothetical protein